MTPQTLAIHIKFESDWGVQTGEGRHGGLDRALVTDDLGLPMVPAVTIKGVLRDAAGKAAFGLDEDQMGGRWAAWVDWLFGSIPSQGTGTPQRPVRAALGISPGYLVDVREAVRAASEYGPTPHDALSSTAHGTGGEGSAGTVAATQVHGLVGASTTHPSGIRPMCGEVTRSELAAAVVIERPCVEVDSACGAATDDTLRMEHWGRAGLTVHAEAFATQPLPVEAQLLLRLAAELVTSLGYKRRGGRGACRLTVDGLAEPGREQVEELAENPESDSPADDAGEPSWPVTDFATRPELAAPREPKPSQRGFYLDDSGTPEEPQSGYPKGSRVLRGRKVYWHQRYLGEASGFGQTKSIAGGRWIYRVTKRPQTRSIQGRMNPAAVTRALRFDDLGKYALGALLQMVTLAEGMISKVGMGRPPGSVPAVEDRYPPGSAESRIEGFKWFVGNRRKRIPIPEPKGIGTIVTSQSPGRGMQDHSRIEGY